MARPLSLGLRETAVAAVLSGESCRSVAARFTVSASSVIRWAERQRETGSVAARPMGGVRRAALAGQRDWLLGRIGEKPDLTLAVLAAELRQRGVVVAISVIWRFFRAEGISFNKMPAGRRAGPAGLSGISCWGRTMLLKETSYATTQTACHVRFIETFSLSSVLACVAELV
jgi:putative transposase